MKNHLWSGVRLSYLFAHSVLDCCCGNHTNSPENSGVLSHSINNGKSSFERLSIFWIEWYSLEVEMCQLRFVEMVSKESPNGFDKTVVRFYSIFLTGKSQKVSKIFFVYLINWLVDLGKHYLKL